MSHYLYRASVTTFVERRPVSWRVFFNSAIETMRTWMRRRRQRQELLDYLAIDHRAAADMAVSDNDARDWAERPFWRP